MTRPFPHRCPLCRGEILVHFFNGFPQFSLVFILHIARQHKQQLIQNFGFVGDLGSLLGIHLINQSAHQV